MASHGHTLASQVLVLQTINHAAHDEVLAIEVQYGHAGVSEQKVTVPHNPLSNSLLCGDECERQPHWENHTPAVE